MEGACSQLPETGPRCHPPFSPLAEGPFPTLEGIQPSCLSLCRRLITRSQDLTPCEAPASQTPLRDAIPGLWVCQAGGLPTLGLTLTMAVGHDPLPRPMPDIPQYHCVKCFKDIFFGETIF